MKLAVFGTGYVGLVTGACFAEMGNDVLCVDVDVDKVARLKNGEVPIFEPGLETLVKNNTSRGLLTFTSDVERGVEFGEVIFIAVGTPSDEDGSADLQYVLSVADTIGEHMREEKVVVDKSTVPVGTADKVQQAIAAVLKKRNVKTPFHVVSNPEFLKEGAAVADFMKPDRIVIGSNSPRAVEVMDQLYAPFNRNHDKVVHMDRRSAELTKYAANVMLAAKISLMNEMANLADRLGADIEAVRRGIGMDPRIGYHFIYPGAGYGGSCFPKDVKALIHTANEAQYEAHIMKGVEKVNMLQKRVLFDKLSKHFNGDIKGRTFALWGLAFKPNTDDMREAPSQTLIDLLTRNGAKVRAYDPQANAEARRIYGDHLALDKAVEICDDRTSTLEQADGLIVVTEWNEFRSPDFGQIKSALKEAVIFDGRNLYDPDYLQQLGFVHYGIGRGTTL
ncbi:MAG: UDP-glucose/GDP-mannose dehydrogenase family protein [Gammaproteobacteria bacterium]|nr:UDP-glucose/GDP-mannose dehydrogenase family protein [Gammaproteobacteria bacterium]